MKQCILVVSPTLYKVETGEKIPQHASNVVCGVRGGAGYV